MHALGRENATCIIQLLILILLGQLLAREHCFATAGSIAGYSIEVAKQLFIDDLMTQGQWKGRKEA